MYRLHVAGNGKGGQTEIEGVLRLGVDELRRRYRDRQLSPVEVVEAAAARIERVDPLLNAFVTLNLERAREAAEEAKRRFAAGTERPLEGVPLAVKDLLDTERLRTTYGSSIFGEHVPRADAEAVRRAREAGAILLGKTGTHEFAWGITCDNPHYGACRNPWDRDRISGGSSGGSAVALAAGLVTLALGSDTGGSIRIPASFCGVTGLKPTYGRVSTAGTFPLAPSLDHVGPMAQRPRDAWRLYEAIAGDGGGAAFRERREPTFEGVRIGLSGDSGGVAPSEEVERTLADCVAAARDLGAEVVEVEFPAAELVEDTFVTIQRAEALETHRRLGLFPERGAEYGADVRARLEQATAIGLADYMAATADRGRVTAAFADLFAEVDVLVTPVSPVSPVRVGETATLLRGHEADFRKLVLAATTPQSLAGLPACTVRAGFDADGLPVGVQVSGPQSADARVTGLAEALFEATAAVQEQRPVLPI